METDRSSSHEEERRFIGFYASPAVKKKVQRRAEQEGTTVSEWMRQLLQELEETAQQKAVTT